MPDPLRSLRGWMAVIFILAVGGAALRHASDAWAAALVIGAMAFLGLIAARGVTRRTAGERVFGIVAGATGIAYLAVAVVPALERPIGSRLPTTKLLERLHPRICLPRVGRTTFPRSHFDQRYSEWRAANPVPRSLAFGIDTDGPNTLTLAWELDTLPSFRRIGHALLSMSLGLVCGWLATGLLVLVFARRRTGRARGEGADE